MSLGEKFEITFRLIWCEVNGLKSHELEAFVKR